MIHIFRNLAFFLLLSCFLFSCSSKGKDSDFKFDAQSNEPPEVLYQQAADKLAAGQFADAAKKFSIVDQQYPYTDWGRKALVMGAFSYYRQGKYAESVNMAERYVALYPISPDSAYAYYIIGLSYFQQIPPVTQDQTDAVRAIRAFQEIIERYPRSEYVADSKHKIRFAREQLAGKEMQVGRYYLERAQYLAALKRFRFVVEQYANTNQIEEALYRLVEVNYALGLIKEAQSVAHILGKNYASSSWYQDAFTLLGKNGFAPQAGQRNWVNDAIEVKK